MRKSVMQTYPDTCAIKSQQLILEAHGCNLSESELRAEAIQHGWYIPNCGTPINHVSSLLEHHGMIVQHYEHASMSDITNELSQGHQLMVCVDSGELWKDGSNETFEDIILGERPDHALLVSGITLNPFTAEENVLLTDPGTGDVYAEYSIEQFEDAWDDSRNFMVSVI